MKKIKIKMLLYALIENVMEVQKYMLNPFGIILFYKVVGWFDGQDISVEPRKPRFSPSLLTYTMWNMYIHIYFLYICVNV
jgi:hypothetical protein